MQMLKIKVSRKLHYNLVVKITHKILCTKQNHNCATYKEVKMILQNHVWFARKGDHFVF